MKYSAKGEPGIQKMDSTAGVASTAVSDRAQRVRSNAPVSARSTFSDEEWDFSEEIDAESVSEQEKIIKWRFPVTAERDSYDPAYSTMLLALRELAYVLLFLARPRKKYGTVVRVINQLKNFVRFLSDRPHPVTRFRDVLETDLEVYIDRLKEGKSRKSHNGRLSPYTLSRYLLILNKLHDYKDHLTDHLRHRPTKDKSPNEKAGFQSNGRIKTEAIPDDELKALVDFALDYIRNRAPIMFRCLKEFFQFAKDVDPHVIRRSDLKTRYYDKHFFSKRSDYRSGTELNGSLIRLRTACFVIIAFCTGMRPSEVLAAKRGCIRRESEPNHGTFNWIKSTLFKTQKKNSGTTHYWMCGEVTAEAAAVLEEMVTLFGANNQTNHLFFSFLHFALLKRAGPTTIIRCLSRRTLGEDLKDFCEFHGLGGNIHPHRFRRSFARNIIRYTQTPILALKEHFKHWSLYMTDWYIGLDSDLIEDLEAERILLSNETWEKITTQPAGGAGGRRFTRELEKRMAEGRLPRNFRGKAGAEFRKSLLEPLHESGLLVIPCGTFTFCVFQEGEALCTKGKRPIVNRCNPYDCKCSFILEENVPFYRKKLSWIEARYGGLPEEGKAGPIGLFYRQEMMKVRKALEPFDK